MCQFALLVEGMAAPLESDAFIRMQSRVMRQNYVTGFEVEKVEGATGVGFVTLQLVLECQWQVFTAFPE